MTSRDDPAAETSLRIRSAGLVAGLILAIGATAALVLTDDTQNLRLAVIAALWAFLIAAFVAGQRRASTGTARSAEVALRRSYEHELEREVTARREYELRLEVSLRREMEGGLRADVNALREEIQQLHGDLVHRWNGELRVETVALRAESTRVSGNLGAALTALAGEGGGATGFDAVTSPELVDEADDRPTTIEFTLVPPVRMAPDGVLDGQSGRRQRRRGNDDHPPAPDEIPAAAVLARLRAVQPGPEPAPAARRHRYREDDEPDEVLARVLGRT